MRTIILTTLLALSLPAAAEDHDTFCGITEGQGTANVAGKRQDSRIILPYTLGVYPGTRVVGVCEGRVFNVTWNRLYIYGVKEVDGTPVGSPEAVADEVTSLFDMLTQAGWSTFKAPAEGDTLASGMEWRVFNEATAEERSLSVRQVDDPGGIEPPFYVVSLSTATAAPCTTGI